MARYRNPTPDAGNMTPVLEALLQDSNAIALDAKQAHWNVKGPSFQGLHKLFDEINAAALEYADLLAERLAQFGKSVSARPVTTGLTPMSTSDRSGFKTTSSVAGVLAKYAERLREAVRLADDAGDAATVDILSEILRGTDKWLWMVESHLGESSKFNPNGEAFEPTKCSGCPVMIQPGAKAWLSDRFGGWFCSKPCERALWAPGRPRPAVAAPMVQHRVPFRRGDRAASNPSSRVSFGKMEKLDPSYATMDVLLDGEPAGRIEAQFKDVSSSMARDYRIECYLVDLDDDEGSAPTFFANKYATGARGALAAAKDLVIERLDPKALKRRNGDSCPRCGGSLPAGVSRCPGCDPSIEDMMRSSYTRRARLGGVSSADDSQRRPNGAFSCVKCGGRTLAHSSFCVDCDPELKDQFGWSHDQALKKGRPVERQGPMNMREVPVHKTGFRSLGTGKRTRSSGSGAEHMNPRRNISRHPRFALEASFNAAVAAVEAGDDAAFERHATEWAHLLYGSKEAGEAAIAEAAEHEGSRFDGLRVMVFG